MNLLIPIQSFERRAQGAALRGRRIHTCEFLAGFPVSLRGNHRISVSGLAAQPSSWSGSTGLLSHEERQIVIIASDGFLPPQTRFCDAQNRHWSVWSNPERTLFPHRNHHVSLPHESTLSRFFSLGREK